MRVISTLILVCAPAFLMAQDQAATTTEPEPECQSCTARHKSLQSLQQARTDDPPKTSEMEEVVPEAADE